MTLLDEIFAVELGPDPIVILSPPIGIDQYCIFSLSISNHLTSDSFSPYFANFSTLYPPKVSIEPGCSLLIQFSRFI
jgi:hypothetical protein